MAGRQMEGDNQQRRAAAREAREHGKIASEVGATTGSSKQRTEADENASHQERVDLKREGKQKVISQNTPEAGRAAATRIRWTASGTPAWRIELAP